MYSLVIVPLISHYALQITHVEVNKLLSDVLRNKSKLFMIQKEFASEL